MPSVHIRDSLKFFAEPLNPKELLDGNVWKQNAFLKKTSDKDMYTYDFEANWEVNLLLKKDIGLRNV